MKPVRSCDVSSHHHHDKLEVWPSSCTQFTMQSLSIAMERQCAWGYTRGGVWPLKNFKTSLIRVGHSGTGQALDQLLQEGGKITSFTICTPATLWKEGGAGNAARITLFHAPRIAHLQRFLPGFVVNIPGKVAGFGALTAGAWSALQPSVLEVSAAAFGCFSGHRNASCGIFLFLMVELELESI